MKQLALTDVLTLGVSAFHGISHAIMHELMALLGDFDTIRSTTGMSTAGKWYRAMADSTPPDATLDRLLNILIEYS